MATPLSPGSEVREKERVTVLLEINKYLLMEVMRLQAVQAEAKKEDAIAGKEPETEKEKADREKERMEKAKKDYFEYVWLYSWGEEREVLTDCTDA